MRVLVTDSDSRSALAATRSLGKHGHQVFTSGSAHPSLASVSRYSSGFDAYANPASGPAQFVADVLSIVDRRKIDVLLPMTEVTTLLLTERQHLLPDHVRLPFPPTEIVAAANDKATVLRLAAELGVPIPRTEVIYSADQARDCADRLFYPTVIKAARSRIWTGTQWLSTSVNYATDPEDLLQRLAKLPQEIFPVLLQERIEGPGVGVFLCCDDAGPIANFSHRRIREKPPSGGVSVLCESTPTDPIALDHATRLLQRLQWRGVAMVEFKRDLRDGSLRLMEINGRFWGSLQLAIDAGVDFPVLLAQLALGQRPASISTYRLGIRTRWLWGDIDSMLALLLRSGAKLNLSPSHPGRWVTLARFLRLWEHNTRYELERLEDLRPCWLETRRRVFRTGV